MEMYGKERERASLLCTHSSWGDARNVTLATKNASTGVNYAKRPAQLNRSASRGDILQIL